MKIRDMLTLSDLQEFREELNDYTKYTDFQKLQREV